MAIVTVALVEIPIPTAYKRAFVTAKLTLGSGASAGRGVGAGLFI
jgi:hypothetical protein